MTAQPIDPLANVIRHRLVTKLRRGRIERTYFELVEPMREVTYMAGIARDLAWELLEGDVRIEGDSDVIVLMSKWCHEQLLFALIMSTTEPKLSRGSTMPSDRWRREQSDEGRLSGRPFCFASCDSGHGATRGATSELIAHSR